MAEAHIKEIEWKEYILTIDVDDLENMVIQDVVCTTDQTEQDPETFQEDLDIDDWQEIKEILGL